MNSQQSVSFQSIRGNIQQCHEGESLQIQKLIHIHELYTQISKLLNQDNVNLNSSQTNEYGQLFQLLRKSLTDHVNPVMQKVEQIVLQHKQTDDGLIDKIIKCELSEQMTFMQMINTIIEQEVDLEQLFQFLDNLKIQSKNDLILLSEQAYQTRQQLQDDNRYYNPLIYFQTDISQLFIEIISDKINCKQSLNQRQKDLINYLTQQKDIKKITSDQLHRQYHYTKQKLQLDTIQLTYFIDQVKNIQSKLLTLLDKNNYLPSLECQFKKADSTKLGKINYLSFNGVLSKLRLGLSDGEINTLFKYCIYLDIGVYQQLINKAFMVDYKKFISQFFGISNKDNNSDIVSSRIPQYKSLVDNLKKQKLHLHNTLTQKDKNIQKLQSKLLQYELQHCNKQNSLHQIVKNQRKMLSGKYQSEISRLKRINQSQKQMIDSYRVQLENIMAEIHTRQTSNSR